jgi:hypothetical protein
MKTYKAHRYLVSGKQPIDNVYCQKRFSTLLLAEKWGLDLREREVYDIQENQIIRGDKK